MPELPEVETVVRELAMSLPGHRVSGVEVVHEDLLREPPHNFRRGLKGARFDSVTRRGKNILLHLSPPQLLVVNLGMTGQVLFAPPRREPQGPGREVPTHLGVVFELEPSGRLIYADTRRFGCLRRYTPAEWETESGRLGPEPFDPGLSPADFHQRLGNSRSPMRSWLLDQRRIAGVGNIYALEALFRSGIHPRRPANSVGPGESASLLQAIREVLSAAIRNKGTTLRDYRTASGERGSYGASLQAYGGEGEPCPRCNTSIERIVFGNRSAFFCPSCQKNP